MVPKILITRPIPENGLKDLYGKVEIDQWNEEYPIPRKEFLSRLKGKEGVICLLNEKMDREAIDAGDELKVIANYAVGYDNIDVDFATEKGIMVLNTPGVLTDATADLAFALILSSARRIGESERYVRNGKFKTWGPKLMLGKDVWGATLGVVGAGKIGRAVMKRGKGFDMKILYNSRSRKREIEEELEAEWCSLEDLLRRADYVSLNCPLTEETKHMIGERELSLMRKDSILINTARGPVVNEKALYKSLKNREILYAGLDVYENEPEVYEPLLDLDNVVLAPHIGSSTVTTRTKMAELAAGGLLLALSGGTPDNIVNPEVLERG